MSLSATTGVPAEQVKIQQPLEIVPAPPQMYPAPQTYHPLHMDAQNDPLSYTSWTFFPGVDMPCASAVQEFPFPGTGSQLALSDDDSQQLFFGLDFVFPFFGVSYSSVYVGSNGYLTFESADSSTNLENFNSQPLIAALVTDLDPSATTVGSVTYEQLNDVYVVTFNSIPVFESPYPDSEGKSFQVALHADGRVTVTYLELIHGEYYEVQIIGLSSGDERSAAHIDSLDDVHACEGYVQPDAPMAVVFNTTVLVTSQGAYYGNTLSAWELQSWFSDFSSLFGSYMVRNLSETVYSGLLPGDNDMPPAGNPLASGFWEDLFPVTPIVFFSVYFNGAEAASLDTLMPMVVAYVASYAGMQWLEYPPL